VYLRETGWGCVEWIQLAQDRDSCEYGGEPSGSGATELSRCPTARGTRIRSSLHSIG
jgi:hypothetical protein